ncbi:2Fe-2S iron-sulfur cluster-binding protein [Sphingomonas sp. SRS2]|uniref:2Fe-2S iron-sulfur cluster-binding protein n=1 Tax=Sphingomonas sp. SRS2 TaxID=133190 RepID=UPI0009FF42F8|nr:2Fe-2S iron-sulfur cluster-binding protein [Sphingomonas sp. SRS2]
MLTLIVVDRLGGEHVLPAASGRTVMEVIREGGLDELLASCGGCCACATCHIHIDERFWSQLPPISADENDLLEGAGNRHNSRLACQFEMTAALDRMRVIIARDN